MAIPRSNPSYISTVDEGAGTDATSTTSAALMAANPDRQYCRVTNVDGVILVALGLGVAAEAGKGIVLGPLEHWEMPSHAIFTGAINVESASGTPSVAFVEY